jgi:hypothetical protein
MQRKRAVMTLQCFAAFVALSFSIFAAAANRKISLAPKFSAGDTFRYQIRSHTHTTAKLTTPILNPEGGTQSDQTIQLVIRLNVLGLRAMPEGGQAVRLRALYERSNADSESDAFDPNQRNLARQYSRMEAHSVDFTISPDGQLTDFSGLEDVYSDRSAAQPVLSWLNVFSTGSELPKTAIETGQKWKSERPLPNGPFSDLIWKGESSYLRDETCGGSSEASTQSKAPLPECAVILTEFQISRRGSPHDDATPEDYVRNGLRTSGTWTGSGQSLDSISLKNGTLVSSTETSDQKMDYEIKSATTRSSIHQVAQAHTQTEVTPLPVAALH